jgi:hypothetical protein
VVGCVSACALEVTEWKCCCGDGSMEEFRDKKEADIALEDDSIQFFRKTLFW